MGVCLVLGLACELRAQTPAGVNAPGIREPHEGDCSIVLEVANAGTGVQILLNKQPLTLLQLQNSPLVFGLGEPLRQGDELRAVVDGREYPAVLVGPLPTGGLTRSTCTPDSTPPPSFDTRGAFEASAYVGSAFDNFAPNVVGNYANLNAANSIRSRWIAGVEAQYLLWPSGSRASLADRQFWISTKTLHGVRTADINCKDTPSVAVCSNTALNSDKFLFILEHATTIEAHIDPRFEFLTLQRDSSVPTKLYVTARFGFLDLEGAPKVFNSDSFGLGILTPSGVFKDSYAQVAWGRSEQFQSNRNWNRLKIDGVLVVDIAPSLKDRLEFWKRLGGSSRAFVAISVDRNPGGPGPDSVQSYVGIDFDLQTLVAGFK
jgi:hypothetical protein